MIRRLYLMQGVPGSGKSTMAEMIQADLRSKEMQAVIYSTDDWRYAEGKYVYDPETNKVFHQECQKATIRAMQQGTEAIIVDNTNIEQWQAQPYIEMAKIFDYEIIVVRVECDPKVAIERQANRPVDRQIPAEVIEMMYEKMERITAG